MRVEYKSYGLGKEYVVDKSISEFLRESVLCENQSYFFSRTIRLEDQPEKVLECVGRFVSVLLDKGILNLDDLKHIAYGWNLEHQDLKLKPEDKDE